MSAKEFREGLSRFKEIQDGPAQRKRVLELEEMVREKDRQIEKINLNHGMEVFTLLNTIATHENRIHVLEASNESLESIRISIGGKEKVSLRKFARLVTSEAKKENQEAIVSKANDIVRIKLPLFVKAEIDRYPNNCTDETRSIIDSKTISRRNEYLNTPSMWSREFQTWINNQIETGVIQKEDEAFWKEVHLEANIEINQRLPAAWKNQLENYATKYMQNSIQHQLRRLSIPITLFCPKCNGPHQITLTPDDIAQIIRKGSVSYPCIYCTGLFKPQIIITLGELLWLILNGDVIPQRIPVQVIEMKVRKVDPKTEKNSSPS